MKCYKRILIQLFFLLFVTETFGIYKFAHFCGSEKTSESYFIEKNSCCCGDDEDEADECCSDETAIFQLKEENTLVQNKTVKSPDNIAVHLFYQHLFSETIVAGSVKRTFAGISESRNSHPEIPLIIRHRSLLI